MSRFALRLFAPVAMSVMSLVPATSFALGNAYLAWSDCRPFGQSVANFACNTNAGTHVLVPSFTAPANMSQMNGIEATIHFLWEGPTDLPWWQLRNFGGTQINQCRHGSVTADTDFLANGLTSCADPFGAPTDGGIAGYVLNQSIAAGFRGARLIALRALPTAISRALTEGTHYYGMRVAIDHAKTSGTGACSGCDQRAMMWLQNIRLYQEGGAPNVDLPQGRPSAGAGPHGTMDEIERMVGWQCPVATASYSCGANGCGFGASFQNCTTPSNRSTWGAIKTLYR